MRRSKLESYEAILEALVKKPLTADSLAYKTNTECTILKRYLYFLIKNALVEERPSDKKTLYANTERGIAVFKALNFERYIQKIAKSILTLDDASQAVATISTLTNEERRQ